MKKQKIMFSFPNSFPGIFVVLSKNFLNIRGVKLVFTKSSSKLCIVFDKHLCLNYGGVNHAKVLKIGPGKGGVNYAKVLKIRGAEGNHAKVLKIGGINLTF